MKGYSFWDLLKNLAAYIISVVNDLFSNFISLSGLV